MTYNVDLMLQVREQITSKPDSHDQDHYEFGRGTACGTTRCIAGWAIYFAEGCKESIYENRENRHRMSDEIAAELLGLDEPGDTGLFYEFDEDKAIEMLDALIEKGKNQ